MIRLFVHLLHHTIKSDAMMMCVNLLRQLFLDMFMLCFGLY